MGCKNSDWTPEETEMLRGCIAGRLSSGATAATMSRAFDRVVTRNAVISKARALGLMFDSCSGHNLKEQKRKRLSDKPKSKNPVPRSTIAPLPRKPIAPALAQLAEPAAVVIPITARVTLFDLTNSTCRWPVERDDDQWMFCGAHGSDFAAGMPYCAAHAQTAHSRVWTPEERQRHREKVAIMQAAKKMKARAA